jgi:hypothetical protein
MAASFRATAGTGGCVDCVGCDVETGVVDNEVLEVEFTALWLDGRICRGSNACC